MGFLSFVKVAMIYFDAFAWPILALGYPLVESIRAIEANLDADTRKLITYWVLFSLLSLFEHAFLDLILWVPLWHYVKLMIICWLTIPSFDGAFYVYNSFVHPCLSMDLETIINRFKKQSLSDAQKCVSANEPKALENVASNKMQNEPDIVQKDVNSIPITEEKEKEVTSYKEIARRIPSVVQAEKRTMEEVPRLPQVQREWTCAMCQVTVKSEVDLKSHLKGRRHKEISEEVMKPKNLGPKGTPGAAGVQKKSGKSTMEEPVKKKPEKSVGKMVEKKKKPSEGNNSFRCSICNISCSGLENMMAHLAGKKHSSMVQDQKLSHMQTSVAAIHPEILEDVKK